MLEEERYKKMWCLGIKGLKENSSERIREDVILLLGKITPEFAASMSEAVDVVHRVGRKESSRPREVILLFARRMVRDEIWKRTKMSSVCKEAGIRFAEDLTKEDKLLRRELWPRIEQEGIYIEYNRTRRKAKQLALEAHLGTSMVNVFLEWVLTVSR